MSAVNPHLAAAPVVTGAPLAEASLAVVVVHGRGQDPEWMRENLIRPLDLPRAAYVLPVADGGSWYPNRFFEPTEDNAPWLGRSLEACTAAVRLAESAGVPVERIALMGFSQGACLVAELVSRDPRPYAAVAILTGGVIGSEDELGEPAGAMDGLCVLLTGHEEDEWVPARRVVRTAELFRAAGARVKLAIHDDPEHQINDHEVAAVRRLLVDVGA